MYNTHYLFYRVIRRGPIYIGMTNIRNSQSCCANRPEIHSSGRNEGSLASFREFARVKGDLAPLLRNATDKKFLGESAGQRSARIPRGEIHRISRRGSGSARAARRERTDIVLFSLRRWLFPVILPFFFSATFADCRLPVIITAPPNLFREISASLSLWFPRFFSVRRPITWLFN